MDGACLCTSLRSLACPRPSNSLFPPAPDASWDAVMEFAPLFALACTPRHSCLFSNNRHGLKYFVSTRVQMRCCPASRYRRSAYAQAGLAFRIFPCAHAPQTRNDSSSVRRSAWESRAPHPSHTDQPQENHCSTERPRLLHSRAQNGGRLAAPDFGTKGCPRTVGGHALVPKSGAGNRRPFQGPCRPTPNVQRKPHETQKNKNELPQRNRDLQKKVMLVDRSSSACQQHTATVDVHVSKGSAFTALAVEEAVARGDAASPNASRTKHDARSSSRGASAPRPTR